MHQAALLPWAVICCSGSARLSFGLLLPSAASTLLVFAAVIPRVLVIALGLRVALVRRDVCPFSRQAKKLTLKELHLLFIRRGAHARPLEFISVWISHPCIRRDAEYRKREYRKRENWHRQERKRVAKRAYKGDPLSVRKEPKTTEIATLSQVTNMHVDG
jgi:hypothetical protein